MSLQDNNKKSSVPFYLLIYLVPIIQMLLRWAELIEATLRFDTVNPLDYLKSFPFISVICIFILLLFISKKNIDTSCFNYMETFVISLFMIIMPRFMFYQGNSDIYMYFSLNIPSWLGGEWGNAFITIQNVNSTLSLSNIWYYICIGLFMLIRSGRLRLGKMKLLLIFVITLVFSIILVLARDAFISVIANDCPDYVFAIASEIEAYYLATYCVRCMVMLYFFICIEKGAIGVLGGILCSIVKGCVIYAIVNLKIFMQAAIPQVSLGSAETVACLVVFVMLIVCNIIRKAKNEHKNGVI